MNKLENLFKNLLCVIIIGFAVYGLICFNDMMSTPKEKEKLTVKSENLDFLLAKEPTNELVYKALLYYNVRYPRIVLSQAILETGRYRSRVCKEKNNLFGLWNTPKSKYFKFDHWSYSVKAYIDSIQYRCGKNEDYYDFLNRIGYAEDPEYVSKLKEIEDSLIIEEL